MRKLLILSLCLLAVTYSSSAQTSIGKISGTWIMIPNQGESLTKKVAWSFYTDGSGKTTSSNGQRYSCSTEENFNFTITGDSIRIVSGVRKRTCIDKNKSISGEDHENTTTSVLAPHALFIKLDGLNKLRLGSNDLKRE